MTIECRLFADLRRHAPPEAERGRFALELDDGATAGDVVRRLAIEGATRIVVVNGANVRRPDEAVLHDGDVVSLFPPVSGG